MRRAWARYHVAYQDRAATSLCAMLAPSARTDLEAQVGVDRCAVAAAAWFGTVEYDRPAAVHARLVSVQVNGTYAETYDSDPNSPASECVKTRERWELASFFVLG